MSNDSDPNKPKWSHLAWAAGGALFGAWLAREKLAEAKKSETELDDPEFAENVYSEIGEFLDAWEPEEFDTEDEYTHDLADYLGANIDSDWDIEISPTTSEGKPDILVENTLALELKVNPTKGEIDRCIGQCARYSRQWITLMVILGASPSQIGNLETLLLDRGLEQIEVWHFPLLED